MFFSFFDFSTGRVLSEKRIWGCGVNFFKKRKLCKQNLKKAWRQSLVVIQEQKKRLLEVSPETCTNLSFKLILKKYKAYLNLYNN